MKLKLRLGFNNCVKLELLLVGMIVIFTIFGAYSLVSLCFTMSFIVLLIYTGYRVSKGKFSIQTLLVVVFAALNVVINAMVSSGSSLGFDYFKKVIMFISFVLFLYYSYTDSVSGKVAEITLYTPCAAGVLLIISYFLLGNTATYARGITLGFTNPNFTGMWLLHIAIYMFLVIIDAAQKPLLRIAMGGCFIAITWLIVLTLARSCLFGLIFFLALCLLKKFFRLDLLKNKIFLIVVILIPLLFVFSYYYLIRSSWFLNTFSFLVSEGKPLTSRTVVWSPAIESLKSNFLLGDYYGISNGTGSSQMHNTHLDVLCSYGIITFGLFLGSLYSACVRSEKFSSDFRNYCALAGFLSIVIMGTFEAGIVAGAMGLNFLTGGLLIIANSKAKK